MGKLISLKDKPATKEDIGKEVFEGNTGKSFIIQNVDPYKIKVNNPRCANQDVFFWLTIDPPNVDRYSVDNFYWSKPVIISESEYKQLTAKLATKEMELEHMGNVLAHEIDLAKISFEENQALKAKIQELEAENKKWKNSLEEYGSELEKKLEEAKGLIELCVPHIKCYEKIYDKYLDYSKAGKD